MDKFFYVCTGYRQFRVFERQGQWWGLIRTYASAGRARFCVERLKHGKEKSPFAGRSGRPFPFLGAQMADHLASVLSR